MEPNKLSLDTIVAFAKRRGFVFPGSEIYGGLAGTFDYGPYGALLKENIKQLWWRMFVDTRDDMYRVDAAILMNPKAWEASGHVSGFSDPLVECENCHIRLRVDQIEGFSEADFKVVKKEFDLRFEKAFKALLDSAEQKLSIVNKNLPKGEGILDLLDTEDLTDEQTTILREVAKKISADCLRLIDESKQNLDAYNALQSILDSSSKYVGVIANEYLNRFIKCPNCSADHKWGTPRQFNMMFRTQVGATEDETSVTYLRPETAGGIFVNFKNVVDSMHPKLPFGIGQVGKAFRNEIAPREFLFRLRELEQMEVEYFVKPSEWEESFNAWQKTMHEFAEKLGLSIHELNVEGADLAHYSKKTIDFEFDYPFGRKELWGLAYRTDFDLSAHQNASGEKLEYLDEETKEKFLPHVIEPSLGVDRTFLAVLVAAYREDEMGGETRSYLALPAAIAPVKAMVAPLLKNKPELVEKAKEVRKELQKIHPAIAWDDNGNIGKRYRRQDEIGTPFCITIDFDTLGENPALEGTVTIRHRDTGEQERVTVAEAGERIKKSLV